VDGSLVIIIYYHHHHHSHGLTFESKKAFTAMKPAMLYDIITAITKDSQGAEGLVVGGMLVVVMIGWEHLRRGRKGRGEQGGRRESASRKFESLSSPSQPPPPLFPLLLLHPTDPKVIPSLNKHLLLPLPPLPSLLPML